MSLRYEVWTLPWSGSFQRVIADLPVVEGTGKGNLRLSNFGSGQLGLPYDYTRLSDVISSTTGTLIRVLDGTSVVHEWVAQRVAWDMKDSSQIIISGPDLLGFSFDRTIVYPYDYTTNPTTFPNHVWGGSDSLSNGGFETPGQRGTVYELWNDASSGTFTLDDGVDTTAAIAYNASASTVETRLETDITAYDDVNVSGSGTESDPWIIEFVDPLLFSDINLDFTDSLTGGSSTLTTTQFGALEPSGWTKSQQVSTGTPFVFGEYDSFVVSTAVVRTGTYSLFIDPAAIGRRFAGAQQVVSVQPGGVYQASVYVYPTAASQEYRLVIRGIDEDFIASTQITATSSTWNQLSLSDVSIPAGTTQVIFRIANINATGNPAGFYVDDASFAQGASAAAMGVIATSLMDDAASDHSADARGTALDWVDYTTWTSTLDSSAAGWPGSVSLTVPRGMSMGQWLDQIRSLDYEFRMTPKTSPGATTHDLELYGLGNLGTDYTGSATPSLTMGQGVEAGKVVQRIPNHTAVLVEGAGGIWVEDKDATAETNFGRLEAYLGDTTLTASGSIQDAATHLLYLESGSRTTIQVKLKRGPWPVPLVAYTVGDELNCQFPPLVAKTGKRVAVIAYQNTEPNRYDVQLVDPPVTGGGSE